MLKIKKILIAIVTVMFSGSIVFGQNSDFDSRLLAKYSAKELTKIEKDNPAEIEFLTFCLDNAFYIGDYPVEKDGKFELDGALKISNLTEVNIYQLDIDIKDSGNQMFSVNDKSKLLIIYDNKFLRDKFKQAKL